MKRTKFNFVTFLCVLTMALALVGCGGGPSSEKIKAVQDKYA